MNLLPDSARWICVGAFAGIAARHAMHAARTRRVQRLWHSGHLLMALGMTYMFLPPAYGDVMRWSWRFVFVAATALAAGYAVVRLVNGTTIDVPWVTLTAGLGIMAYMLAVMGGRAWAPLTYGAAMWLAAEAVGWFTGALCGRHHARQRLPEASGPSGADGARATAPRYLGGSMPLAYDTPWLGRATLGLMAVGMAYMLIATQLGQGTSAGESRSTLSARRCHAVSHRVECAAPRENMMRGRASHAESASLRTMVRDAIDLMPCHLRGLADSFKRAASHARRVEGRCAFDGGHVRTYP